MTFKVLLLVSLLSTILSLSASSSDYKWPFQDPRLSWQQRLDDLVDIRLSIDDLVPQSQGNYSPNYSTPAVERYGIKPYVWITECLTGVRHTNGTAFQQPIGFSSMFSPDLLHKVSTAISKEARGFWNHNKGQDKYLPFQGLTCYSPVINIMRHPLWGRNMETYGEDPFLTGELSKFYVSGLQGDHPRYVRAVSTCKHFDVHTGPENIPIPRKQFDSKLSTRDWRMTFLPAFKACVGAGANGVMCSYNSINGIPSCANKELLADILRGEWGYQGYVTSDSTAVINIKIGHHYLNNSVDVAAAAINAGCNHELSSDTFSLVPDAIKQKKLTVNTFRESMKKVFYVRMRLGEFDPPGLNPYSSIPLSVVQSAEHRELAIQVASASFVLLKNNHNTLPLTSVVNKAAFVGPVADSYENQYGQYSPNINPTYASTVHQGLSGISKTSSYTAGCKTTSCLDYNSTAVIEAVKDADIVVVCLGTGKSLESENNDRHNISLPGHQLQLLQDATKNAKPGAKVILLLFNAGPLDISWAKSSDNVSVIMECFYPGQATGLALNRTLTGYGPYSVPAGRLTATWPITTDQVPDITNYNMSAGFTYRYFKGEPLYPFGYGLSYSAFKYLSLDVTPKVINAGESVMVRVEVQNVGQFDADEVVQLYMSWNNASLPAPKIQLVGFQRAAIKVNEIVNITLKVIPENMEIWLDDVTKFIVPSGEKIIYVGGQQPNTSTVVPSNVLSSTFNVLDYNLKYYKFKKTKLNEDKFSNKDKQQNRVVM